MRTLFFILCFAFAMIGAGEAQVKTEIIRGLADSSADYCNSVLETAEMLSNKNKHQQSYEAYQTYFESCAYLPNSYTWFLDIGGENNQRSQDNHRFEDYREWLKAVLYYNVDTNYYCSNIEQILTTFSWFSDLRGEDYRGGLAMINFIVEQNRCPNLTSYYDSIEIPRGWHALWQRWMDTLQNENAVFDSTLPSLDDLGLGILRGNPADVKRFNDAVMGPVISSLYSIPNPFASETTINFTCRERALLKFEVFDILGKKVYDGGEHIYNKGENSIIIGRQGIPNGLLYGRFILPDGSIRTIKLRKLE